MWHHYTSRKTAIDDLEDQGIVPVDSGEDGYTGGGEGYGGGGYGGGGDCPVDACVTADPDPPLNPPPVPAPCAFGCFGPTYPPQLPAGPGGGTGTSSQAPSKPPAPSKDPCVAKLLNALNNQVGGGFTQADVQGNPFPNGGGTNINILGTNLPSGVFNSIQTGRYPINPISYVIGYGATLNITGTTWSDPPPAIFLNSNVGGNTSVLFTIHTDTSYAYNPIGYLIHLIRDELHIGGPRAPCPV